MFARSDRHSSLCLALSFMVSWGLLSGCQPNPDKADTIYTNARIYTVNTERPWAEAVAVRGNTFIAVGSTDDVLMYADDETEVIDLAGKMILPGFFDPHIHLEDFYLPNMAKDRMLLLPPLKSIEEIRETIATYAADHPDLDVIFGKDLPNELFPNDSPTRGFLDAFIPDRAVVLLTVSGHEALLNGKALELAGITATTPDPENGEIVRDTTMGEATGFMKEAAYGKFAMPFQPALTLEQHTDGMAETIALLNAEGITSVKHIHAQELEVQALHALDRADKLNLRVATAWTYKSPLNPVPVSVQELAIEQRAQYASDRIYPNHIKVNIDGIPTATAAMLEPYEGTNNLGMNYYDTEPLAEMIKRYDPAMDSIVFHTVGDRGARIVLDALEQARDELGSLHSRPQLAHAHFIADTDFPRMQAVNLTAEFSPIMWFEGGLTNAIWNMVGEERTRRYMPLGSAKRAGVRVVIGSDGPILYQTALASMESAVTRLPPGGGNPSTSADEAITLAEAIAARTIDSAYLNNKEHETGSIEVGKLADFVVIDRDLFAIPIEEVSDAKVLLTVIDGQAVYTAE